MEHAKPENLIKLKTMRMPYGKYQGTILIDLPERYVIWMHENKRSDAPLGLLLQELYEIKVNGLESLIRSLRV